MSKTPKQETDDKIEALQLQLIEEDALIEALTPVTLSDHMGDTRTREQQRRMHKAKRDAIKAQIAFLTAKKSLSSQTTARSLKPKTTKQAQVYGKVVKMKANDRTLKNTKAFEILADILGCTENSIHRAYYAEQRRLRDEKASTARAKRDSESHSDQQNEGEKKSPK